MQRALALAGVASRRAAEDLVRQGRVAVNGQVASVGQVVDAGDVLTVDGERVEPESVHTYLLNKPIGRISSVSDPEGRPTVLEGLPADVRLYPVGRLDLNTSGALLVTNDGELAHRLMHPRYHVTKTYDVRVEGRVSAATLRRLRDGVVLEDGPTQPAKVERMDRLHPKSTWLRIEITEGRNRQVRRMCEVVGHRTERLHRSRYAGLALGRLPAGAFRPLTRDELRRLARQVGLER